MKSETKTKKTNTKWLEIRKTLSKCSERDLIGLISDLYTLSESNQDFLEARFIRDKQIFSHYKSMLRSYIAPREPWRNDEDISIRDAKKVISDYKKATGDIMGVIDLRICYVEYGTHFTCKFGDMYAQYYDSLISVFESAIKLMKDFEYEEISAFVKRLRTVVKKAEDNVGWGYSDAILEILDEAYPNT